VTAQPQYYENILKTIGRTPLVRLNRVSEGLKPLILAKVEYFNPGGSVKDRIGVHILEKAEKAGQIKPGDTIVESTSGNTGCGLAIAAAVKGYKVILTMPDKMSREKINLLKAYGAKVVIAPTAVPPESPESYYNVARRIVKETPGAFLANQYFNPDNPESHFLTTGPEIWEQTGGKLDVFVATVGTGGTISGTSRYLKSKNAAVRTVGADPDGSILCEQFYKGTHGAARSYLVEGIGEDIIPGTLDFKSIDEILTIGDRESFRFARRLAHEEGILCGGSGGTAVAAALRVAEKMTKDQVLVVLIPDTGERYLSKFHNDEWMRDNRMLDVETARVGDVVKGKSSAVPALVTVREDDPTKQALALIRSHNVSQLPVRNQSDQIVGTVLEGRILSGLLEGTVHLEDPVRGIQEPGLPLLAADQPVSEAARLLAGRVPAVLVQEGGQVVGILTRFDVIEYVAQ
jgi:cystathionine beta-synthase